MFEMLGFLTPQQGPSMAAVSDLTTYQEALAAVERLQNGISTDEKIRFLEATIGDLDDPGYAAQFKADIKDIGLGAVETCKAFDRINQDLKKFMAKHKREFPALVQYQKRWESYVGRFQRLLWASRDFAVKTSTNYEAYVQILIRLVDLVRDKEDMEKAADALERFSREYPPDIPWNFSQRFLDFGRDVKRFLLEFDSYLDWQDVRLTKEARKLKYQIDTLQVQIDFLTKVIKAVLGAAGAAEWRTIVASSLSSKLVSLLALSRAILQSAQSYLQDSLEEVNEAQTGLMHIRTELNCLALSIFDTLYLFSTIWAQLHSEAVEFAHILRQLPTAEYPLEFRLRIDLAKKTAIPLEEALEEYATQISSLPADSRGQKNALFSSLKRVASAVFSIICCV